MPNLKSVLKKVTDVITVFFAAVGVLFTAFFMVKNGRKKCTETAVKDDEIKAKADEAALKKEKEIEEKSGSDLILESDDPAAHMERIEREQNDFRERVRNRLNQNIPG